MLLFIVQECFGHGQKVRLEDLSLPRNKILLAVSNKKQLLLVGSKIFCQVIDILMGSDPAPFFLFFMNLNC